MSRSAEPSGAQTLLRQIGVTKGICALPGDTGCKLALSLARASDLVLYVQLADRRRGRDRASPRV